jgi:hypothetical protein
MRADAPRKSLSSACDTCLVAGPGLLLYSPGICPRNTSVRPLPPLTFHIIAEAHQMDRYVSSSTRGWSEGHSRSIDSSDTYGYSVGTSANSSECISRYSNYQAAPLTRSVPPTGTRLTRILEMFRVHLHSVAKQIGPDAVREYVEESLRQDYRIP